MSVGSITSLPVITTQQPQAPVASKPATQTTAQPLVARGGDNDGDNDGSGGASVNITPPVNIKA